jgi:hypothetical protein
LFASSFFAVISAETHGGESNIKHIKAYAEKPLLKRLFGEAHIRCNVSTIPSFANIPHIIETLACQLQNPSG